MAVTIDNRANTNGGGFHTATLSLTVSAVSPLIVGIKSDQGEQPTVTWNTSEPMVLISSKTMGSGLSSEILSIYGLRTPTTGTHNVTVTWILAPSFAVFAISTIGGDIAAGWRPAFTRNNDDGSGPGLTVTNAVRGDMVFHAAAVIATTITFAGGENTSSTLVNNIDGNGSSAGLSTISAMGSTAVSCTNASPYCEIGVSILAASPLLWAGKVM
jgi:hypothetical protein